MLASQMDKCFACSYEMFGDFQSLQLLPIWGGFSSFAIAEVSLNLQKGSLFPHFEKWMARHSNGKGGKVRLLAKVLTKTGNPSICNHPCIRDTAVAVAPNH